MELVENWPEIFENMGVKQMGHFELHSGLHSSTYVNKDLLLQNPVVVWDFSRWVVDTFLMDFSETLEIVVGPESGGAKFAQWIAFWLQTKTQDEVLCAYPEKTKSRDYVFKRNQGRDLKGKKILIVDDVLTSGDTIERVRGSIEGNGGIVSGLFVIWNRSNLEQEDFDVQFAYFAKEILPTWEKEDCPLCKDGVPLSDEFV